MKRQGFTLVELMMVVVVIMIIAAIAIPVFLRNRISANEAAAISSLRTISTAQAQFRAAQVVDQNGDGDADYGTLEQLGNPPPGGSVPFIDSVLSGGTKQGYLFTMNVVYGNAGAAAAFSCLADPVAPNQSGTRRFFVDETGVIRATNDGTPAGAASPPIG